MKLDHEALASEFMRALRGRRSQAAFAKRLRYRSNVAYAWESGRNFPTAADALRAAARTGTDVHAALEKFMNPPLPWLAGRAPDSPEGVAALLREVRGRTPIGQLAESSGLSRFAVSRFLKARAEPRLPDFFRLMNAATLRLLDFISAFVDPAQLASLSAHWAQLQAARHAAYEMPLSQLVLRALELAEYQALAVHEPGWIATRVGITLQQEQQYLEALTMGGQVIEDCGRYRVVEEQAVDTRHDPERAVRLRHFWSELAISRIDAAQDGVFSYNLVGVSDSDWFKLRELHRSHFRQVRSIVAQSQPVERVLLLNTLMLPLDQS